MPSPVPDVEEATLKSVLIHRSSRMEGPRPSSENQSRSLTFEGDRFSLSLRRYVTEMERKRYERLIAAYDFVLLIRVDLIGILRRILRELLVSTCAIKAIDRIAELEREREK